MSVHFSSDKQDWETPIGFFLRLDDDFSFKLDAAASRGNRKCARYYCEEDDSLAQDWFLHGSVFLNPPYGRIIGKFMQKAYEESCKGCLVVCLIPARTDTKYWHDYVMKAKEIRLVKGRLKFGGAKNSAPFPSAVVVFAGEGHTPKLTSMDA